MIFDISINLRPSLSIQAHTQRLLPIFFEFELKEILFFIQSRLKEKMDQNTH